MDGRHSIEKEGIKKIDNKQPIVLARNVQHWDLR